MPFLKQYPSRITDDALTAKGWAYSLVILNYMNTVYEEATTITFEYLNFKDLNDRTVQGRQRHTKLIKLQQTGQTDQYKKLTRKLATMEDNFITNCLQWVNISLKII